jgi:UDP-N-acetylmuramoylalanine--D-glutamate ligase
LVETSTDDGTTVVELSSFQLETIKDFRPNVGVCLNVTPNHLDRYDSFQDYAAAKHRLFINQTCDDVAILNADDKITSSWAEGLRANVIFFSVVKELDEGFFLRGRDLVSRAGGKDTILISRDDIFLLGLHNVENVLAAFAVALACGADIESIRQTVKNFKGVEHRIEFVTELDGVKFYNDSKATSVDATSKALLALGEDEGKTILILGGRGKNAPYAPLIDLIRSSVRSLVLVGEDADNIESQLKGTADIIRADSMDDAVAKGFEAARSGDSVLLAPACASFDMFKSFEERGDIFKKAVLQLQGRSRGTLHA